MSSLLIIGGSGFFGKSILDSYRRGLLNRWGVNRIFIFARNASHLRATNPILVDESVELIDGDIAYCNSLPKADYIIHAAASSDASRYVEAPEDEKRNILAGTINFCNLAKKISLESKILYVSSGAVYGASSPKMLPFDEADSFIPLEQIEEGKRHYAAAKRDSEAHIMSLGNEGVNVAIARCFAFVGKFLPRDQHFAIGNFIQNGINGRPIVVRADKRVYRSYMYADDLVEWLMTISSIASPNCPIFNVGSDEKIEIRDLAALIARKYGVAITQGVAKEGEVDFYIPSINKASSHLGLSVHNKVASSIELSVGE